MRLDVPEIAGKDFHLTRGYDSKERLTEIRSGTVEGCIWTVRYCYDDRDRVVSIDQSDEHGVRTIETDSYEHTGRRTSVYFLLPSVPPKGIIFCVEGDQYAYGAPGARTLTTKYDERGHAEEVLFHNANHMLVRRVTYIRDSEGRLLVEEAMRGATPPLDCSDAPGALSPEESMKISHAYDAKGHLLERLMQIGQLEEVRTLYRYDDCDNPIEETAERHDREPALDETGGLHPGGENVSWCETRYAHVYDAQQNWIERVTSYCFDRAATFTPNHIERRSIEYYKAP